MASAKSWQKPASSQDKYAIESLGKAPTGNTYKPQGYESDAKNMAGREKKEMEKLFGKTHVDTKSKQGAFEKPGSSKGALPSMFAGNGGASGTLMSSGSSATMKVEKGVFDSVSGGSKVGKSVANGEVSRLNVGSAGVMDTKGNGIVDVANRGNFAGKSASGSSVSKLNMGSAGVMDNRSSTHVDVANRGGFGAQASRPTSAGSTHTVPRGPNTQAGVLRKMPWEN